MFAVKEWKIIIFTIYNSKLKKSTLPVFFSDKFESKQVLSLFIPFFETIGQRPTNTNIEKDVALKRQKFCFWWIEKRNRLLVQNYFVGCN